MFCSIVGWLEAGLCSVVLQESRPRLVCVQLYCRMAGLAVVMLEGWPHAGLCSVVVLGGWSRLACVQ